MEIPDEIFLKHSWEEISVYLYVKRMPDASLRRTAMELGVTKGKVETAIKKLRENGFLPNAEKKPACRVVAKKPQPSASSEAQAKPDGELEERKRAFVEALRPYLSKYGKDMMNKFYLYWTQVNPGGKRMLFERQQAFELAKRLATWGRQDRKGSPVEELIFRDTDKDYNKNLW